MQEEKKFPEQYSHLGDGFFHYLVAQDGNSNHNSDTTTKLRGSIGKDLNSQIGRKSALNELNKHWEKLTNKQKEEAIVFAQCSNLIKYLSPIARGFENNGFEEIANEIRGNALRRDRSVEANLRSLLWIFSQYLEQENNSESPLSQQIIGALNAMTPIPFDFEQDFRFKEKDGDFYCDMVTNIMGNEEQKLLVSDVSETANSWKGLSEVDIYENEIQRFVGRKTNVMANYVESDDVVLARTRLLEILVPKLDELVKDAANPIQNDENNPLIQIQNELNYQLTQNKLRLLTEIVNKIRGAKSLDNLSEALGEETPDLLYDKRTREKDFVNEVITFFKGIRRSSGALVDNAREALESIQQNVASNNR